MPSGIDADTFEAWKAMADEHLVERVFDFCYFTDSLEFRPESWREDLLPGFEVVCGPWQLLSEVLNGGFCQFLSNQESTSSNRVVTFAGVEGTLRALRRLRLADIEELLMSAIDLYKILPEVSANDNRWRPLDIGFSNIADDQPLDVTLATFFRSHRDEFVTVDA